MSVLSVLSLLVIGAVVGLMSNLILKERGIKMLPSILVGSVSALIGSAVPLIFGLTGVGFYGIFSSVAVLFTINVFRTDKEPVFEIE
jgi:uncharacterized membrane protein YeaQ/YmgE (transglycosylase-associated protein family)